MTIRNLSNDQIYLDGLIRCRRKDDLAESLFELVIESDRLYVYELPSLINIHDWIATVIQLIDQNSLFKTLGKDAEEYTLHMSVVTDEKTPLILPSDFLRKCAECQLAIEIYFCGSSLKEVGL